MASYTYSCGCADGVVWNQWVTSSNSATATSLVWGMWTGDVGTSNVYSTSNANTVWVTWNDRFISHPQQPLVQQPKVPTPEEVQKQQEQWAEAERKRKEADLRADELLNQFLDEHQRDEYRQHRHFTVRRSGRSYRLRRSWSGNVDELNEQGKKVAQLCIHPVTEVPLGDLLLTQKLMLENDEDTFQRIANRSLTPA